ncbi:MAG: hypothetical protein LC720_08895, partial [Actinobacteria bacterium]|nr:hypothetical protein [Actinomycetota bacterium]
MAPARKPPPAKPRRTASASASASAPAAKRRPAAAKRRPAPARSRPRQRSSRPARPARPAFAFEQRHYDVLGLGLVAFGVFLGVILYSAADGGRGGHAVSSGLGWLVGQIRYAVPLASVAIGALFVLRPVLPSVKPFRTGTILLFCALTLGLAANTLGVAPAGTRAGFWQTGFFETHGGVVGEAELWAASHLIGLTGAH